jgi:hypothetical protein
MKKITLLVAALLIAMSSMAQTYSLTTSWELTSAQSNAPSWMGTTTRNTRSMAYGKFENNWVVAVASREGGNSVRLLSPADGSAVKTLSVTGISGGAIVMSDVQITNDQRILVSNVVNASASVFKIYSWVNSTDAPTVAVSYTLTDASRYGDHFTVTGSLSDGSAKIYAVSTALVPVVGLTGNRAKILCWSMISDGNGGFIFDSANPTIFSTAITTANGSASICPLPTGKFIFKGNGSNMVLINSDGTLAGSNSVTSVVLTGGNSVKHLKTVGTTTYVAYFRYGTSAPIQERMNVIKIENENLATATSVQELISPNLGILTNGDGSGRIAVEIMPEGQYYVYVLSTNNGFGKYKINEMTTSFLNSENEKRSISISGDVLKVEGVTPSSIELFNAQGQKVSSITNSNVLNINNLKGIFIVQLRAEGKIVKAEKISL